MSGSTAVVWFDFDKLQAGQARARLSAELDPPADWGDDVFDVECRPLQRLVHPTVLAPAAGTGDDEPTGGGPGVAHAGLRPRASSACARASESV